MKTLFLFSIVFVSYATADQVEVKTGGFRIRAPQLQYYYETRQETVIEYINPLLAESAKVEIELAVPKHTLDEEEAQKPQFDSYEMTYQGEDKWSYRFETLRHGLGANWMYGNALFVFKVTLPGKKPVKIECEDSWESKKGFYNAAFDRIRDLPWRNNDEPFVLKPAKVECEIE